MEQQEQKELKIIPPEGYEIDSEHSTLKCIKFKKKNSVEDILKTLHKGDCVLIKARFTWVCILEVYNSKWVSTMAEYNLDTEAFGTVAGNLVLCEDIREIRAANSMEKRMLDNAFKQHNLIWNPNTLKAESTESQLPKTWEEFCHTHSIHSNEVYIDANSNIKLVTHTDRLVDGDRNVLPSIKDAEAIKALCQLIQLRDCYNQGWKPDWNSNDGKYIIGVNDNSCIKLVNSNLSRVLAFKSAELRNKFLENFEDLLNRAKPLL